MGLTGALKEISTQKCGHCRTEYGRHSKKQFMKCLYTANWNLYSISQEYNRMLEELKINKGNDVKEENETINKTR